MTPLAAMLFAIPAVVFSDEHQAMVRAGVGEVMPRLELFDTSGQAKPLEQLRGERATIVAVLGGSVWMTEALLNDLTGEIPTLYGSRGVSVVIVSLGAAAPLSDAVVSVRTDRAQAAKLLGEGRMPRVYVLDRSGAIVWFDIEYSVSTHRELIATLDELAPE